MRKVDAAADYAQRFLDLAKNAKSNKSDAKVEPKPKSDKKKVQKKN